jgi:hypothetical protein
MRAIGIGIPFIRVSRGAAIDAQYQAILNRGTALGYTLPSAGQQAKQNQLIIDLKTAGVWDKLDVYYVFAHDGQSEFGTLNWKNPLLHQATLFNSPTFTANQGFAGNGSSSYIRTNFNPFTNGVNYQLNNASRYCFVRIPVNSQYIDGVANGNDLNHGYRIGNSPFNYLNQDGGSISPNAIYSTTPDLKSIQTNLSNVTTVIDGTTVTLHSRTASARPDFPYDILRNNNSYGSHQVSCYGLGAYLVAENTAFRNAFSNYLSSL